MLCRVLHAGQSRELEPMGQEVPVLGPRRGGGGGCAIWGAGKVDGLAGQMQAAPPLC
jgi:hypothetical protein